MKYLNLLSIFILINSILLINTVVQSCDPFCVNKGEKCYGYYSHDILTCSDGLVCGGIKVNDTIVDYKCKESVKKSETCFSDSECDIGLICHESKCQDVKFAILDDKCKGDTDCSGSILKCVNGICSKPNTTCEEAYDCKRGFTCIKSECVAIKLAGQSCESGKYCDGDLQCVESICTLVAKKSLGQSCNDNGSECLDSSNLVCSPKTKLCEVYIPPKNLTCDEETPCDKFHSCGCDNKCYQSSFYPKESHDILSPYIDCIDKFQCHPSATNFESKQACLYKNCAKETCAYYKLYQKLINSCGDNRGVNHFCSSPDAVVDGSGKTNSSSKTIYSTLSILFILIISCLI